MMQFQAQCIHFFVLISFISIKSERLDWHLAQIVNHDRKDVLYTSISCSYFLFRDKARYFITPTKNPQRQVCLKSEETQ